VSGAARFGASRSTICASGCSSPPWGHDGAPRIDAEPLASEGVIRGVIAAISEVVQESLSA